VPARRRSARGLEGEGAVVELWSLRALARRRRQGDEKQGGEVPEPTQPAGEVASELVGESAVHRLSTTRAVNFSLAGTAVAAAAYNGVCTQLVTKDGKPVPPVTGRVVAGKPQKYPTETVPIEKFAGGVPNLDQYKGLAIDYGRMEPTVSDPSVQQQYGMVAAV